MLSRFGAGAGFLLPFFISNLVMGFRGNRVYGFALLKGCICPW